MDTYEVDQLFSSVRLSPLVFLPKTSHKVQRTEPSRIANRTRDWFKVFNRLGRRQQTIGEVRLLSDSSSPAPRNQRRANSRALRSDDADAFSGLAVALWWPDQL